MHAVAHVERLKKIEFQRLYGAQLRGRRNVKPEFPKEIGVPGEIRSRVVFPVKESVIVRAPAVQNEVLTMSIVGGRILGVGIRGAGKTSEVTVVAIPTHIRIVVQSPRSIINIEEAMRPNRRRGRREPGDVDAIGRGALIAARIPSFHIQLVIARRNRNPCIQRSRKILEKNLAVDVDDVSGYRHSVLCRRLDMDGRDQVRRARGRKHR